MQQEDKDSVHNHQPENGSDSRKKTPVEQRRQRRWRYYVIVFAVIWIVANLLGHNGGHVWYNLTSSRWIIATVLGGLIAVTIFGFIVKTLYAMQRGHKHRRILRKRSTSITLEDADSNVKN